MESVTAWVASVVAVLSIIVTLAVALAWRASMRRSASQIAELKEALAAVAPPRAQRQPESPVVAEFLITDIGSEADVPAQASSRLVLSAAVGEPLVKLAAFAHGVRKALTPENRNRIRFEMRREIRRARKARRVAGRAAAAQTRSQAARS